MRIQPKLDRDHAAYTSSRTHYRVSRYTVRDRRFKTKHNLERFLSATGTSQWPT